MPLPQLLRIIDFGPYTQPGQMPPGQLGSLTLQQFETQMEGQIQTIVADNLGNTIRFYATGDGQGAMIDYAIQQGLAVIPSVSLPNPQAGGRVSDLAGILADPGILGALNDLVSTLESLSATDRKMIPFVCVGDEAISPANGGWTDTGVEAAIDYVKDQLPPSIASMLQFTTAETDLGQYINLEGDTGFNEADVSKYRSTDLGNSPEVNVIFANIYGYWDGVPADQSAAHVAQVYQELKALYPNKEVVISETGWPSAGPVSPYGAAAVAGLSNEAIFWSDFLQVANQDSIPFAAFEAFDEPYKAFGLPVEGHWGLLTANGAFKTAIHSLTGFVSGGAPPADFLGDGVANALVENTAGAVVVGEVVNDRLSYATVGGLGSEWLFRGKGDFNGDGEAQFLIENSAGVVVLAELQSASGGSLHDANSLQDTTATVGLQAQYVAVANLGPEWSFRGVGDLFGDGKADFVIENTSGVVVVGEVQNDAAQYTTVGGLGPEWSFRGVGDFLGDAKSDLVLENTAGTVVIGEVGANDQLAYTDVTGLGPEWKFVGTGDLLGDGIDDILIENAAGAVEAGEIGAGHQVAYTLIAALGPEWSFEGVGDFLNEGHDQFMIENASGVVVIGDYLAGQIHYTQVGGLGPEWSFH